MSRDRFELGAKDDTHDLDFDPEITMERLRGRGKKYEKNWRDRPSTRRVDQDPGNPRRLYIARRLLRPEVRGCVITTIGQLLEEGGFADGVQAKNDLGFSVLAGPRAKAVYGVHFQSGNNPAQAVPTFNQIVAEYAKRRTRKHPFVATQLGQLGINGPRNQAKRDKHFVSIEMIKANADLVDENRGIFRALSASSLCSDAGRLSKRRVSPPHLSIAVTPDYEDAAAILEYLEEREAVTLLQRNLSELPRRENQPANKPLILGRLETMPGPIVY